ncbi:hypothetical protein [Flammeovirga kamogawensis]|uniref:Carboxypeptidase regulatory-like domain-containing protein n=1 Tax=Flammeovirga kamogawensis TaxID=373891 RepID=A0ABX8H4N9_9BACT|nr:hypothetical protein [Flammeovirga kamogawensis]MBB6463861.1 hypothetical protein [Flammeovirga kamogawensis]QWG10785.1 hypothetical protein KM029_26625 [Flammeovirga kamogawensis]TRX63229.1 hypothetical protein EO216_26605 [Flammeovirga kamogawensis]
MLQRFIFISLMICFFSYITVPTEIIPKDSQREISFTYSIPKEYSHYYRVKFHIELYNNYIYQDEEEGYIDTKNSTIIHYSRDILIEESTGYFTIDELPNDDYIMHIYWSIWEEGARASKVFFVSEDVALIVDGRIQYEVNEEGFIHPRSTYAQKRQDTLQGIKNAVFNV